MFFLLFSLFIILPIIEVSLIFQVTEAIGGWNTIGLVIITGFLGAFFAKKEGRRVWLSLRKDLQTGVLPADSILHGFLVFIGGFLLITPGFLTDFLGLSLIFSPTRKLFVKSLRRGIEKAVKEGKIRVDSYSNVNGFQRHYSNYQQSYEAPPEEKQVREAKVIDFQERKKELD